MPIQLVDYQQNAAASIVDGVIRCWESGAFKQPIVFKAPTGSGKTLVLAHAIRGLSRQPNWQADKAFIWVTFSEQLALQSRDKLRLYFGGESDHVLLTSEDISRAEISEDSILFLNWQKLVAKDKESRKLRRPDAELDRRESGRYFEDFIDAAVYKGLSLILVIDEAHTNVTPDLAQEIIDYINPRVVVHVSATPKPEIVAQAAELDSFVRVNRQDVVNAGLIKEKIVIQTSEDLASHGVQDFDHVLLQLGLDKRESLKDQFLSLGKKVNPLLLIQLPNDDSELVSRGEKTKEQIVTDYLQSKGIDESRIARWFDNHPKPAFIEENDDAHDVLIFKLAAGTGWDCPRAQVLVMFRNIRVEQRYIQTVGRILRMPEPDKTEDYSGHPDLRSGFLFTNYDRTDVVSNWVDQSSSGAAVFLSKRRIPDSGVLLKSDFISRTDFGDLSSSSKFQSSFCTSMDEWFGFVEEDMIPARQEKLERRGLRLEGSVKNHVVVDAEFSDFDQLSLDFRRLGQEVDIDMSSNDVEKTFNFFCWSVLKEQTEDSSRVSSLSRSWSPFKSALRVWLKSAVHAETDLLYRIAVADFLRGPGSALRPAITQALKDYRPILDQLLDRRLEESLSKESYDFSIRESYSFPANYEQLDVKRCALSPFFLPSEDYRGKTNELEFIDFLESREGSIDWWFKQGVGRDFFGLHYVNTRSKKSAIFYPDWILKLSNGKLLIADTKLGQTASDTEGRAEALAARLKKMGANYLGGIIVKENGIWHINQAPDYEYTPGKLSSNWKRLIEVVA